MTTMSHSLRRLLEVLPAGRHADAERRFARHEAVLADRLHRLYGHLPGHTAWFDNLLAGIGPFDEAAFAEQVA